jgi:hypothetical protein
MAGTVSEALRLLAWKRNKESRHRRVGVSFLFGVERGGKEALSLAAIVSLLASSRERKPSPP